MAQFFGGASTLTNLGIKPKCSALGKTVIFIILVLINCYQQLLGRIFFCKSSKIDSTFTKSGNKKGCHNYKYDDYEVLGGDL